MPEEFSEDFGEWNRTKFYQTFPMSTYLLAFMICDFGYNEAFTSTGVQTRIYAREDQIISGNVDYAKNITPTVLDYFEDYFDVSYPLPKSDQAAIPDFALGGMENWGLVMYRETALLYDPDNNSDSTKQRVAAVISHELSHQWFGNLISPLWWDELWLNEGFASFIEYLGIDKAENTWNIMDQYVIYDFHTAMAVDGLATSRPVVAQNVTTPTDINGLFDDITYEKAGCVIRMVNQFTGEDAFRLGLKNYLEEYKYGSVEHNQLFQFWEAAINETGGEIPPSGFINAMETWVLQMGFPTVTLTRHPTEENKMIATQQRFLLDPNADLSLPTSPFDYEWYIPFWYIRENDTAKTLIWLEPGQELVFDVSSDQYVIGNYEVFGYYRVNYDPEDWQKIADLLEQDYTKINVKSRAQIIDDAFNLARIGKVPYESALSLTLSLRNDLEYVPWESALNVLSYFDLVLGESKVFGVYSEYLLYLVDPLYNLLLWEDEGEHLIKFQRINAIQVACGYGNSNCSAEASIRFEMWKEDPIENRISPNLRSTLYCQGVSNGGADDWDFVWDRYQNEADAQERSSLQYALTCSKIPWINQRFLERTIDDTLVRKQDASGIFQNLCYNIYARDITWDFLRQNWDYVYEVYGTGFFSFSGIITSCTSHFSTEFEQKELESFIETNYDKLGSGFRAAEQALERTQTNIDWRSSYEDDVFSWLSQTVSNLP